MIILSYSDFFDLVGKAGLEPARLAARDPKSRLSASSSTSPGWRNYKQYYSRRQ